MAWADPEPSMIRSLRVSQFHGALAAALLLAAGAASAQSRSDAASDLLRQRDLELETARADQKKAIEN
jgi:hypothetical protein